MKMVDLHSLARFARRGFSLVEVMIAVFILGIGLIMVITVFPVGGEWTRQATESTISQNVAQNALAIIQSRYPSSIPIGVTSEELAALPGLAVAPGNPGITVNEMCYQFGSEVPCPANPNTATYFWTALVRKTPGQTTASITTNYDVYILVFKKGAREHIYKHGSELPGVRDDANYPGQPTVAKIEYPASEYHAASGKVIRTTTDPDKMLIPAIDEYGIGVKSGTVFRQSIAIDTSTGKPKGAIARPELAAGEEVIVGVPAVTVKPDSSFVHMSSVSPLIYVYQTTLQWRTP